MPALETPGPSKERLDALLVRRGIATSREQANRLILAGHVRVNGCILDKPGKYVKADIILDLLESKPPFVSRGGEKLAAALDHFSLSCTGLAVMDVGASTGGFTDCVLQRGARRVYAVDVGYGQLDQRLREDPRVVVMDRQNIRYISPEDVPERIDFVVADVSFISLKLVLPPVLKLVTPNGYVVVLVKPQFEVGKGQVGKGGVIRDEALRMEVKETFLGFAQSIGLSPLGVMDSPVLGKKGNKEFLVALQTS